MLSCRDVTKHASEYVDKSLPFNQRLKMQLHLFICFHCRRYLKQLRTTIRLVGLSQPKAIPVQEAESIAAKILEQSASKVD